MDFFNDPKTIFKILCRHIRHNILSLVLFCAMFVLLLVFSKCSIGIVLEKCDNQSKSLCKIRIRQRRGLTQSLEWLQIIQRKDKQDSVQFQEKGRKLKLDDFHAHGEAYLLVLPLWVKQMYLTPGL